MGSITKRVRSDGSVAYRAGIVIKKNGRIVHKSAQTFDRERTARAWMKKREAELRKPGKLDAERRPDGKLVDAIERYVKESRTQIGRTKTQVLNAIMEHKIAAMDCRDIRSDDLVAFASKLLDGGRTPSTVNNYMSHLAAIFAVAKPAWGYELDRQAMQDAMTVCKRLGIIGKSRKRDRRPTLDELDKLFSHFEDRHLRGRSLPMHRICMFAIFSTRRQEEITRIEWKDYEPEYGRVLVRDMKHPGEKIGNNVWCELVPEAMRVIETMPRDGERIFPYSTDAISASFTRACKILGIEDLRFHDLRHEGVSRLFEMGRTIPQAASVSGHRSWQSLQRYSHIRAVGDKFEGWEWHERIAGEPDRNVVRLQA
ncbi:site-specific integrase [Rhodobacteraceae bacterium F11138]|nr:site-specific integrase [Rhodobacteraceae bacterium F11138]